MSLGRVSLLVGSTTALPAIAADLKAVADVRWENHKALVCLVEKTFDDNPRWPAECSPQSRIWRCGLSARAASDRTISFLVEDTKVEESVQRLHGVFFCATRHGPDWGGICSAFCQAG